MDYGKVKFNHNFSFFLKMNLEIFLLHKKNQQKFYSYFFSSFTQIIILLIVHYIFDTSIY